MKATIAWWDLSGSPQSIDSLRDYLDREGVEAWTGVHGVRLKFWIADRERDRWGAVLLWESDDAREQPNLPPHAAGLIGYPPTELMRFDVEAVAEGVPFGGKWSEMAQNLTHVPIGPEFDTPPADPMKLLREWFDRAVAAGVREPGAIALATVSASGRPSSRMIQTSRITDRGLVFATHSVSPKAREIAETRWASGVLYWHATNQQVLFTARAELLPDAEAEALWTARPVAVMPMSVVTRQSEPLEDEQALLEAARRLGESGQPLPRPTTFVAFELVPSTMEFWQSSPDRLYRRLRYDHTGDGWTSVRLQP